MALQQSREGRGELEERTTEIIYFSNRKKILKKIITTEPQGSVGLLMKDATFTSSETWKEGQMDKSSKT